MSKTQGLAKVSFGKQVSCHQFAAAYSTSQTWQDEERVNDAMRWQIVGAAETGQSFSAIAVRFGQQRPKVTSDILSPSAKRLETSKIFHEDV